MGSGFYSGESLKVSLKVCLNGSLWSTFVVPKFSYGLEVLSLKRNISICKKKNQRKSLKQIQSFPEKNTNCRFFRPVRNAAYGSGY